MNERFAGWTVETMHEQASSAPDGAQGVVGPDPLLRYAQRFGRPIGNVFEALRAGRKPPAAIAAELGLPAAAAAGPASFFADFSAPRKARHVRVCGAAACFAATAGSPVERARRALEAEPGTSVQAVRCLGYCYAAPAALDGDTACAGPGGVGQLRGHAPAPDPPIPWRCESREPVALAGVAGTAESWSVWPAAVASADPAAVLEHVRAAGLKGRGGAGFPVALKWRSALGHPGPRTVVANGDEGDPGSFADRLLMEEDPHRVLEGLALACFAVGASRGVVFVRSEYPRAVARMRAAVQAALEAGHLGERVHRSRFSLQVDVAEGAGSYVSGEETALLNGLDGLRGVVRARPPYPSEAGLSGRPTVVNNVETLAAIPWILAHGGAAYAEMGSPGQSGTIVACLSERFARPGAYEVETGTAVRRVIEEFGGGLRSGAELRSLQVGGPLGGFLGPEDLDVPLTDEALAAHGAALGHAGMVAFDERLSGDQVLGNLWEFAAAESCGACSPCRVGSRLGSTLAGGPDNPRTRHLKAHVLDSMALGSLCAFGRRVPSAVRSLARVYGLEEWAT